MNILRVIDKNGMFLRDDFAYNKENEIGIDVAPAQGFYAPKWDGKQWVEGGAAPEPITPQPTETERLAMLETTLDEVVTILEEIV